VISGGAPLGRAAASAAAWRAHLSSELSRDGWARRSAVEMKDVLGVREGAWQSFVGGWRGMPVDTYMADGGGYRQRRFGVFEIGPQAIVSITGQPHHQSLEHNRLNGGFDRWFAPLSQEVANSAILARILACCRETYSALVPDAAGWRAEVHQFRIEAAGRHAGHPTPEGRHRDGVFAGLVMLIARDGVEGGVTRLWTPKGRQLASFAMITPGEALFFDDRKLLHEVTPVYAPATSSEGYRDVLVVTFAPTG
jgi:hypothetical protein